MAYRVSLIPLIFVAAQSFAVPAHAQDYPVVAQWNMDNTFGTTMEDTSGNGNNGTLFNVVTSDSGYIFDGSSSKVLVPSSSSLIPGTKNITWTVQIQSDRPPPVGGDYDLVRKGTSVKTGGEYKSEIVYNRGIGKAFCAVHDALGNKASIRGTTNVTDGQLHTITCIKTPTGITLQVDALAPRTRAGNLVGPISTTKPLMIGVKASTSTGSDGDWYYGTIRSATVSIEP